MKKIFTLSMLFVLFATLAQAQSYRKWDFTSWSATTISNLAEEATKGVTGGVWSDTEKANGDNPQPGKCYWSYGDNVIDGELAANNAVIAETAGLQFNTGYTSRRSLAIAVDYPSTTLGDYAGPQYLWLGGGNAKTVEARIACFTIPKVNIGQKITIVAESHKPSDPRGISLFVGDCKNDDFQIGESFKPTTQASYTWEEGWELPTGAAVNEDGTVDVVVYNTNGCHLYSIEVGTASQKSKVAYLYNGAADAETAFAAINGNEKFDVVAVEATGALTLEDLTAYDAIVLSPSLNNAEAIASLKDIRPFIPVLNLNPALYEAWGMGTTSESGISFADVKAPTNALFRDVELVEENGVIGLPLTFADSYQAVSLTGLFANDPVLATVMGGEQTAIHTHNMSHNGYIYLPAIDASPALAVNAISLLINSKSKVTPAPKPVINLDYKNMQTVVSLSSGVTAAEIYYTIDGSEPTTSSTLYTEPFTITTAGVTVKAVALGEGYLLSEVAEQAIALKQQAPAPTISVAAEEGKATVTISSDMADATIYYNYNGSNETGKSAVYTEPIVLTKSRTIYAFVAAEGFINSEVASQEITVSGAKSRTNILTHMDANSAEYNNGSTSTTYYFTWGKNKSGANGHPYYNVDSRTETAGDPDPETGDETIIVTYTELNDEEEVDFNTGWLLRSRGQIVDWENLATGTNYGNKDAYNYATPEDDNPDFPATKGLINLADKNTEPSDVSFPYNAYIVTKEKLAGPFDIVANIGSIVKPANSATHKVVLQVAIDGNAWDSNWQTVGDTIVMTDLQRLTKNITRSYEGTDEVYVRAYLCDNNSKVGFYDIYIANEDPDGIADVKQTAAGREAIFSLNGMRLTATKRGLNIIRRNDGTIRKVMVK